MNANSVFFASLVAIVVAGLSFAAPLAADEGCQAWYADADRDGFGDDATAIAACEQPDGYVGLASDCDDDDPAINPA
ncbi:MAG TPA: hypothetical protein VJB65_03415, partial [Patescibacteria group bacterium]|nr:hypothetical protein [Patescibacteria group bacterium]